MAITDIVKNLEETIKDLFNTTDSIVDLDETSYAITKISDDEYVINLDLPGVGTQYLKIRLEGHKVFFETDVNVIESDASWPFTIVKSFVNDAAALWVKRGLDAISRDVTPKPEEPLADAEEKA